MIVRMLQRRGTTAEWQAVANTLVLQSGEHGVETTTGKFKVGNGQKTWSQLEYFNPDNVNEAKYAQLTGGNSLSGNQSLTGNQIISGSLSVGDVFSVGEDVEVDASLTVTGSISSSAIHVNSNRISGVADPISNTDAANKIYVDNAIAGLAWKEAVHLIAHGAGNNVSLTGDTETLIIDGHPALGQADSGIYRILLTAQTIGSENGIYLYSDDGETYTLSRTLDADNPLELNGSSVYVQEGVLYGTSSWVQSNYNIDSFDDQVWVQFSGTALIDDGAGLLKNGKTLSVIGTADRITVTPDNVDIASNYVGQTSITTVSDTTGITTGIWNATKIAVERGGTGATTAADARTNLGLTSIATASYGTTSGTVAEGNHNHDNRYYTESEVDTLLSSKVSSGSSPTLGTITATNYDVVVTTVVSDTITLDFTSGSGILTRSNPAGTLTISGQNYKAGSTQTLFITNGSTPRTLSFLPNWIWVGSKPTSIAASRTGVLTVTSLGTADTQAVASWVVQI